MNIEFDTGGMQSDKFTKYELKAERLASTGQGYWMYNKPILQQIMIYF